MTQRTPLVLSQLERMKMGDEQNGKNNGRKMAESKGASGVYDLTF